MTFAYPTLYKKDTTGKIRLWYVIQRGSEFATVSGVVDGKLIQSEWTKTFPKNIGKANATIAEEQCVIEITAMYVKKGEQGYAEEGKQAIKLLEPMLAKKYNDRKHLIKWGKENVYAQPKLDGIRCQATSQGLFSRTGKPIVSCPHIEREIERFRQEKNCGPHVVLDGELYNHDFKEDFDTITSLVNTKNCVPEHFEQTEDLVQFHIYDAAGTDVPFGARSMWLTGMLNDIGFPSLIPVETVLVESLEHLDEIYAKWLLEGYEGQMIRLDTAYDHKRSASLLKRKEFMDDEFEVHAIEEGLGNRSGMAGNLICKLPDGRLFGAGIKGGVEFYKELYQNQEKYIGNFATIRFQNYTPKGKPRFPVVKTLNRMD